jgi:integrase
VCGGFRGKAQGLAGRSAIAKLHPSLPFSASPVVAGEFGSGVGSFPGSSPLRYQFGHVRQKPRKTGSHVWVWEYRVGSGSHSVILGTVDQMSEAEAWKATEGRRLMLNDPVAADQISFGAVLDRYVLEALPERKVTRRTYLSWIKSRIRPKWGDCAIAHVKPLAVELWIKGLPLSGRSKGHIREVMHMLFDWAMRWELIPHDRNPMSLVRVKGCSKSFQISTGPTS